MKGKPNLTPKQQRFVEEYLVDLNGTQAAIRAGYAPGGASVQAARLLANVKIASAVAASQAVLAERLGVTQEYVISRLTENVERSMQVEAVKDREGNETGEFVYQGAVANRALELLGKHLGLFADKVEVTGKDGGPLRGVVVLPGIVGGQP